MEGIKFYSKLGILEKVLSGEKTMFRLVAKTNSKKLYPYKYMTGQRIAVLQAYKDIDIDANAPVFEKNDGELLQVRAQDSKGWNNVNAADPQLMPHVIEITSVRQENVQNITDEDCFKEGIIPMDCNNLTTLDGNMPFEGYSLDGKTWLGNSPQDVYSSLADKLIKKGVWEENKMVDVYEFKLVK